MAVLKHLPRKADKKIIDLVPSKMNRDLIVNAGNSRSLLVFETDETRLPRVVWATEKPLQLWSTLPDWDRRFLVGGLSDAIGGGTYGYDTLFPEAHELPAEIRDRVGVSPRLYLAAALRHDDVGVCRHSAQALAAVLVELGVSPVDLAIFGNAPRDKRNDYEVVTHAVLGVRIGGDWLVFDPTPEDSLPLGAFQLGVSPSDPILRKFNEVPGKFVLTPGRR